MGCVPVRPRSFLLPPTAFLSHLPCKSLPWNHHPNGSQCSHLFPGAISGSLGQPWAMPVPQNGRTILLKGILKSNPVLTWGNLGPEKLSNSPKAITTTQWLSQDSNLSQDPGVPSLSHNKTKTEPKTPSPCFLLLLFFFDESHWKLLAAMCVRSLVDTVGWGASTFSFLTMAKAQNQALKHTN